MKLRIFLTSAVALSLTPAVPAHTAVVSIDLLGGLGDFEYAGDTPWGAHAHPDYDFESQAGWVGDYRSTFTFKANVVVRSSGSGSGDSVTVKSLRSSDSLEVARTYEFTNGGGARAGNVEVDVGTDRSPANAASKLAQAIDREQGSEGVGCVSVTVDGGVLYVKPILHWSLTTFSDSDLSDARIASSFREWRYGFDRASPDDTVAVGWTRKSEHTVNPNSNLVYRLVGGGINGSNCQYFGVRNYQGSRGTANLWARLGVGEAQSDVHVGDWLTFRLEHIRMSGFANLPTGASVAYQFGFSVNGERVLKVVDASTTAFSDEVSFGPIPANTTDLSLLVNIDVYGNTGSSQPGIYVDGARLHVRRAGQSEYAKWEIPATGSRAIPTMLISSDVEGRHPDLHQLAADFDWAVLSERHGAMAARLRYLNPGIKVLIYQCVTSVDFRDSRGVDSWYSISPTQYGYVLAHHREWLYENGGGSYVSEPDYAYSYYLHLADPAFQAIWSQRVRDMLLRWRYDGVYIDTLGELSELREDGVLRRPRRDPWEAQQFAHSVIPVLKSSGLYVALNFAVRHLDSGPVQVYCDPFWSPSAPYDSAQYRTNTPGKVPDGPHEEWAFFFWDEANARNRYDAAYWLSCLADMDTVKRWNMATGARELGPAQKRRHHVRVAGFDNSGDRAGGVDGWLQFGLASYLLGHNDWTTFGWDLANGPFVRLDLSITHRLGTPAADHAAYQGDQYLRYRLFSPNSAGGVGGVVVVNGHHDANRTYTLDLAAVDENDALIPAGSSVTLKPHTGRILRRSASGVEVSLTVPTQQVSPNQVLTITVNFANSSGRTAQGFVLSARLPEGMSYVAGSAEASGGSYDAATNRVSWLVGNVTAGQSGTRTFKARVD